MSKQCPACLYEGTMLPHPYDGRESSGLMCYGVRKGRCGAADQFRESQRGESKRVATPDAKRASVHDVRDPGAAASVPVRVQGEAPDASVLLPGSSRRAKGAKAAAVDGARRDEGDVSEKSDIVATVNAALGRELGGMVKRASTLPPLSADARKELAAIRNALRRKRARPAKQSKSRSGRRQRKPSSGS